ncbi:MAG: hypothetical protein U5J63_14395 [Fodinibius sp.]|nr:hypothetical protein [Fodinibius sp.]
MPIPVTDQHIKQTVAQHHGLFYAVIDIGIDLPGTKHLIGALPEA